jgi:hypothetical protein
MKNLKTQGQLISTRNTNACGKNDLDNSMVALRKHLVDRTNLANRTRRIPPYFRIVKQLKKPVDERQGLWVIPDQERP